MSAANSKTVLIVEDDNDARRLLESRLLRSGFRVVSAGCGAEALELATLHLPDAITMDIRLGDMDGTEVVRRLLNHEATRSIPVIFVTGHTHPQLSAQGETVDGCYFLRKPYDPQLLLLALHRVLDANEQARGSLKNPAPIAPAAGPASESITDRPGTRATHRAGHAGPMDSSRSTPSPAELVEDFAHDARSLLFVLSEICSALTAEPCGAREHHDLAQVIQVRTADLAEMCNALLTGVRFAEGTLVPILEPVSVRGLLREVLRDVRRRVRRRNGTMHVQLQRGLPDVRCDLSLMRTAVVSLFSSMIQSIGQGHAVHVQSGPCRLRSGRGVRLSLSVSRPADELHRFTDLPTSLNEQIIRSARYRLAEQLARCCGAQICVSGRPTAVVATLLLPSAE